MNFPLILRKNKNVKDILYFPAVLFIDQGNSLCPSVHPAVHPRISIYSMQKGRLVTNSQSPDGPSAVLWNFLVILVLQLNKYFQPYAIVAQWFLNRIILLSILPTAAVIIPAGSPFSLWWFLLPRYFFPQSLRSAVTYSLSYYIFMITFAFASSLIPCERLHIAHTFLSQFIIHQYVILIFNNT